MADVKTLPYTITRLERRAKDGKLHCVAFGGEDMAVSFGIPSLSAAYSEQEREKPLVKKSLPLVGLARHVVQVSKAARRRDKRKGAGGESQLALGFSRLTAMPARVKAVMNASFHVAGTSTAALYTNWRLNDLYDPDPVIGGPELVAFSEFMAFYTNFRVHRARAKVWTTDITGAKVIYTVVYPSPAATAGSESFQVIAGQPDAQVVSSNDVLSSSATSSIIIVEWTPIWRVLGIDQAAYMADEKFWGTVSASPTTLVYLPVCTFTSDSTTTSFDTMTVMQMEAEFFNRKELTG